jgi:hypothetical protein
LERLHGEYLQQNSEVGDVEFGWNVGHYSGSGGSISAEPAPKSFHELDRLLEKVVPKLSLLEYKRIIRELVKSATTSESDYYGGSQTYGYYEIDLDALFKTLLDMGYFPGLDIPRPEPEPCELIP